MDPEQQPQQPRSEYSDPTQRVTQAELDQQSRAPESTISPLGEDTPLFQYSDNNGFMRQLREAQQRRKEGSAYNHTLPNRPTDTANKGLAAEAQLKLREIDGLIAQKQYVRAIKALRSDPALRGVAGTDQIKKMAKKALEDEVKKRVKQAIKRAVIEFIAANPVTWVIIVIVTLFLIIGIFIVGYVISQREPINNPANPSAIVELSSQALPTEFDPNVIISDELLTKSDAMTLDDIETFLKSKPGKLMEYTPDQLGEGANGRNAAQIIYDSTRGSHTLIAQREGPIRTVQVAINPMVILAKLEKEQSLITTRNPDVLRKAMGYNCSDGAACPQNPYFAGFARQVEYGAAHMSEWYQLTKDPKRGYAVNPIWKVGNVLSISSETNQGGAIPGPSAYYARAPYHIPNVRIGNAATSVLYTYTPWVYHGNYNFWKKMNDWFRKDINTLTKDPKSLSTEGGLQIDTSLNIMEDIPDDKKKQGKPTAIVLHYLGANSDGSLLLAKPAADYFKNLHKNSDEKDNKRVHYIVSRAGTIYRLLDDTTLGAGAEGYNILNNGPVIHIENEGQFEDGNKDHAYTESEVQANALLIKQLMLAYSIPITEVISHGDVDVCKRPGEPIHRSDPGKAFMTAVFKELGQIYKPCT